VSAREPRLRSRSYLLRVWLSTGKDARGWRASVKEVGRGERVGFASLEALVEYLKATVPEPVENTPPETLDGEAAPG
jgi:hypothetical protein